MQNVGRAPNWSYQSIVHVAQDEGNKDSLMQKMRRRKGNVGTHCMRLPIVGKGKNADLVLYQDGSGINQRGEAEWDDGP